MIWKYKINKSNFILKQLCAMGNKSSNASNTAESVNFQQLDKYFSQQVISKWMQKQTVEIDEYLESLMKIYSQHLNLPNSLDYPNDELFKRHLSKMFNYHMERILDKPVKNGAEQGFVAPNIIGTSSSLTSMDLMYLQAQLPELCRKQWRVLYNSSDHGESWAQFLEAILKDPTKTLIIIKSGDRTFGAFMSQPWYLILI